MSNLDWFKFQTKNHLDFDDEEDQKLFFLIMFEDKEVIKIQAEEYTSKLVTYGASSVLKSKIEDLKDYEFVRFSDNLPILRKKSLTSSNLDVKIDENNNKEVNT